MPLFFARSAAQVHEPRSSPERILSWSCRIIVAKQRSSKRATVRSGSMFKLIGALVVYGFAAYGLSIFLEDISENGPSRANGESS
jgi:hypothetical protein